MEGWLTCVNKFLHFALKHYFISKTVRCFWRTLYNLDGAKWCSVNVIVLYLWGMQFESLQLY